MMRFSHNVVITLDQFILVCNFSFKKVIYLDQMLN
jgi:hypothetical protein